MTIVEKTHASQTVTKKGKNYKYDAIECMVKDLASKEESTFAYILVSDFSSPGTLINATEAFYLVSNQIKSPMGENLSAFKNIEKTTYFVGNNYNWTTIKEHLKKLEK
jgi:copper chaperone NosL